MNDRQWARSAAADAGGDVAAGLLRELGYSVLHLHYNSGRHISHNGRDFADLLHALSAQWPMPIEELVLIGHSMGGLVSRSACHHAGVVGHDWLAKLRAMVFLGSPTHGAALERGGTGPARLPGPRPHPPTFSP